MRRLKAAAALTLTLALGMGMAGCDFTTPFGVYGCVTDHDCGAGQICVSAEEFRNDCVAGTLCTDSCPASYECRLRSDSAGKAMRKTCETKTCSCDSDCGSGSGCASGLCYPGPPECSSDADCTGKQGPSADLLQQWRTYNGVGVEAFPAGLCQTSGNACAPAGRCSWQNFCACDSDCPAGSVCAGGQGSFPMCWVGATPACSSDAECAPNEVCSPRAGASCSESQTHKICGPAQQ